MAATFRPDEMIKNFVHKKIADQPQIIEAYNKEIKAAMLRAKRGEATVIEKLEEEMRLW